MQHRVVFDFFLRRGAWNISNRKYHVSVYFPGKVIPLSFSVQGKKKTCFLEKNTTFPASTRKIMSWLGPFRKDHLFRTFEENAIFPHIFLRKIIFHFPPGGKIIFSGEINIIFSNNTRKIKFQRIFFGKTIFSGRLEKKKGFPCSERYG